MWSAIVPCRSELISLVRHIAFLTAMPLSAPIFAFGFGSPWLLGGLALGAIPILIHLLHRRRYVEVRWAAMRFLIDATRKQARRMRLENLILLLIRTLIPVLLVLALARPHFEAGGTVLRGEQPVHRILVIDSSFSMQFGEDGSDWQIEAGDGRATGTRFEQARKVARNILDTGRRGDAWNLVRIAGNEPFGVISQPAFRAETVLTEVDGLTVSESAGDLRAALKVVQEITEQLPEMPRKEVVFITDLQASLWTPDSPSLQRELRALASRIAGKARVTLVNAAGSGSLNAAVTDLTTDSRFSSVDEEVRLKSVVKNFGSIALRDQVVELLIDGRVVNTKRLDLSAGVDTPIDWSHVFRAAGEHVVEVHLQDDSLPIDNHRWLTLPVRDELRALLVDGRPAGGTREAASFYVAKALEPVTDGTSSTSVSGGSSPRGRIRPQIVGEGELVSISLSRYDTVILCNVGLLTDREATLLESFVRSGGGLIILPGDQLGADSYNRSLLRDGKGLLPARIGANVVSQNGQDIVTFDPRGFAHPIVSLFRGNPGAGLESTMTMQYLKLFPTDDSSTVLWFSDGSPALVEKQFGAGRVILAATSADERLGTWAIWAPGFVPLINEAVQFSASGRFTSRQLSVGDPLSVSWPAGSFEMSAAIALPGGSQQTLEVLDRDGVFVASYEPTDHSGLYTITPSLTSASLPAETFAVNVSSNESNLTAIDRQSLQTSLFTDAEFTIRAADDPTPVFAAPEYESGFSIISRVLAMAVLLLLLIEPLMAWKFPAGMLVLGAAFIATTLGTITGATTATVIVVAGLLAVVWQVRRSLPLRNRPEISS